MIKFYSEDLIQKISVKMKDETLYIQKIAHIINTAEYCKDTLDSVVNYAKKLFDNASFAEKINVDNEEEHMNLVLNKAIEVIITMIE